MLSLRNIITCCSRYARSTDQPRSWHRHASLTSAISGGVRKAAAALKHAEKRRVREGTLGVWERTDVEKTTQARENFVRRKQVEDEEKARLDFLAAESTPEADMRQEYQRRSRVNAKAQAQGMLIDAPTATPYTAAASEFLYGTFAVLAALRAKRRVLHKLYVWCGEDGNLADDNDEAVTRVVREARQAGVPLLRVAGNWDKMLNRMADRRPHNGLVLEAGPIPKLKVKALAKLPSTDNDLGVHTFTKPAEDAEADHKLPRLASSKGKRFPFMLWLDRVTDTGNIGAIFRSAYFFGVDAIILPSHGTAPLSAVTIKSSAGAAERLPLLTIDNEQEFMKQSQEHGWKFFATGAARSASTIKRIGADGGKLVPEAALQQHPCVLILGNEAEGLRAFLQKQSDQTVAIRGAQVDDVVDSLNVSVAAGLLTERFLGSSLANLNDKVSSEGRPSRKQRAAANFLVHSSRVAANASISSSRALQARLRTKESL